MCLFAGKGHISRNIFLHPFFKAANNIKEERRMDSCSKKEAETYFSFRTELEKYENQGVIITLEGELSSPGEVAEVCLLKEESNYMRDYITDDRGNLIELNFNNVKKE